MEKRDTISGKFIALRDLIVNYKSGWVTIALGTLLFVLVLCIVFIVPCPTRAQYSVLRMTLAIGISGMSLSFLLFIKNEKWAIHKMIWMAFTFILAYLTNPASMAIEDDCQFSYDYIEGYIVLQGEPVEGAHLSLSEHDQVATTNSSGSFFLPYYQDREAQGYQVKIEWGNFDSTVALTDVEPGKTVRIEIPKEVSCASETRVHKIVNQRIEQCISWIRAQHRGLMDTYQEAEEVTINQLIRNCVPYEKTTPYHRNYYHFTNGIENIEHKKHLVNAGISPNEYQLESSFKLDFFKAYLFEKETDLNDFHVSYGLLNRKSPDFKIVDIKPTPEGDCAVTVEYDEAVQYLFVSRNYTDLEDKQRKRRMEFYGLKPTETLILKRKNNNWYLDKVL